MSRLIDADKLIELIDDDIAALNKDMSREGYDACLCTLRMVTQYIEALPTIEAVPIEDYRSMEQTVYKLTQALAEAEPVKHGRWIYDERNRNYYCSECHRRGGVYIDGDDGIELLGNYCGICGARMDGEEK